MRVYLFSGWCNMKKKYNVVELFSGIGSQARALQNLGIKTNIQATCEWDIHAFIAYDAIHENYVNLPNVDKMTKEQLLDELQNYSLSNNGKTPMNYSTLHSYSVEVLRRIMSAIQRTHNLVDISSVKAEQMPDNTDILTYSFPCQDLSNVGAFHHYNKGIDKGSNSRSSLLWQVGRILSEMKDVGKSLPRYLVMENVPTLLSLRHKANFDSWKLDLEALGYVNQEYPLNAKDFGLPQNRPRLLMISVLVDEDSKEYVKKHLSNLTPKSIVDDYRHSIYYKNIDLKDLLRITANQQSKLWLEAVDCTPNDTPSRQKIWRENPKIVKENGVITDEKFIRTITTKQDRNPNSGNIYFDSGIDGRGKFRYLTPRECLLFMGFTDDDYDRIMANNPQQRKRSLLFSRDKMIRMAGNSIPVKLLEGFFYQLIKLEKLLSCDCSRYSPKY